MTLSRVGFSAREDEWSEVAKLSLATVASVYHTNPTMVGILDNANFSNVKEFARMLYTDTLGPDLAMFEQRINGFLLPRMDAPESQYVEFAIAAKMAGAAPSPVVLHGMGFLATGKSASIGRVPLCPSARSRPGRTPRPR